VDLNYLPLKILQPIFNLWKLILSSMIAAALFLNLATGLSLLSSLCITTITICPGLFVCFNHIAFSRYVAMAYIFISTTPQISITSSGFQPLGQVTKATPFVTSRHFPCPSTVDSLPGSPYTLTTLVLVLVPLLKTN